MTRMTRAICATGALLSLTALATMAYADGRDYNDGPVQTVSFIRTVDGHFDDYMHWLATTYKKQQEAAKAAGLITRYEVLVAQPHTPAGCRRHTRHRVQELGGARSSRREA